jgi:hypothetical protein
VWIAERFSDRIESTFSQPPPIHLSCCLAKFAAHCSDFLHFGTPLLTGRGLCRIVDSGLLGLQSVFVDLLFPDPGPPVSTSAFEAQ